MRPIDAKAGGRANGAGTENLAKRAERTHIRAGVEVSPRLVLRSTCFRPRVVVVKGFDGKKMNLTGEHKGHNQGVHPVALRGFTQTSQIDGFGIALIYFDYIQSLNSNSRV